LQIKPTSQTSEYALAFQQGEEKGFDFFFGIYFLRFVFLQIIYWITDAKQKTLLRLHLLKSGGGILNSMTLKISVPIFIK
jgi:hypothetical protein